MTEFHTVLAIAILIGLFDGVQRFFTGYSALDARREERERREDLIRRGYIV